MKWSTGREQLGLFLNWMNGLEERIQWTVEEEKDREFHFMDVKIIRQGNRLETTVYRKPTHSNRYLHFNSYHYGDTHKGIVKGLAKRARRYCSTPELLLEECRHLRDTLMENNYPKQLLDRYLFREGDLVEEKKEPLDLGKTMFIPYVDGLYQKLKKLAGGFFNLNVLPLKRTNLDDMLVHRRPPKRELLEKCGVVYKLSCADCNAV